MTSHAELPSYFTETFHKDWDIVDFMKSLHTSRRNVNAHLSLWMRALRSVSRCSAQQCCSPELTDHACLLVGRYKSRDRKRVTDWLDKSTRPSTSDKRPAQESAQQPSGQSKKQKMNSHIPGPAALINNCSIGGDVNQQVTHNVNFRQDPPESQKSPTPPAQGEEPDSSSSLSGTETPELSSPHLVSVRKMYASMHDRKWFLSPDRCVEDEVYNYCRRLSPRRLKGSLLRAFVLDVSDQVVMKSLFSAQEVETIKSAFPSMPQLEKKFLEMLDRFVDVESIRDLRCRLYGVVPRSPDACVDDRKMVEWIEQVYWNTLYLFDCEKKPLTSNHNEQWFNSNIWSRVIDTLFLSLPSVDNLRSEVVCVATSILANSNRTDTGGPDNRRKLGPRLDGIFRMKNGDKFEVGAIEVSKSFDSTTSTKWIHDSKKLRFALRDMLLRLHDIVDTCGDDGVIERLQTVGILNAGLKFQLVRCWAKRKGGVVLCKASELLEFPTSIEQIAHLGTLLQAMAIVKKIVEAVNKEVEQRVLQKDRPAIRRTTVPAKIDT